MLVALHGQHALFSGEGFLKRGGLRRLRLVPFAVVLGRGMNIVGGRTTVDDLDGLTGHYAQHLRMVLAAGLIGGGGFLGNIESAIAEALLTIHKPIRKVAAADDHVFSDVRALAGGILAHVNLGGFRGFAIELHGAADAGCRGGINRGGGPGGPTPWGPGAVFPAFLFFAPRRGKPAPPNNPYSYLFVGFCFYFFSTRLL